MTLLSGSNALDPAYNVSDGVVINIKPGVHLSGKITLPIRSPAGNPVIGVGNSFAIANNAGVIQNGGKDITHIFWYHTDTEKPMVRYISVGAFASTVAASSASVIPSKIRYVELPEGLRIIGTNAFFWTRSLDVTLMELPSTLIAINSNAFNQAFTSNITGGTFTIPGAVSGIGERAFTNMVRVDTFRFGTIDDPSKLENIGGSRYVDGTYTGADVFNGNGATPNKLEFYASSENQVEKWVEFLTGSRQGVDSYFANMSQANRYFYFNGNTINQ